MSIEDAYLRADEHLRTNLKEVKHALKGAKDKDRQLILASGAVAVIYASEMYNIAIDETVKSIGGNTHPAVAIRSRLNAHLDQMIARFDEYVKTKLN